MPAAVRVVGGVAKTVAATQKEKDGDATLVVGGEVFVVQAVVGGEAEAFAVLETERARRSKGALCSRLLPPPFDEALTCGDDLLIARANEPPRKSRSRKRRFVFGDFELQDFKGIAQAAAGDGSGRGEERDHHIHHAADPHDEYGGEVGCCSSSDDEGECVDDDAMVDDIDEDEEEAGVKRDDADDEDEEDLSSDSNDESDESDDESFDDLGDDDADDEDDDGRSVDGVMD